MKVEIKEYVCNCGKTVSCKSGLSMGDFKKRTGWNVLMTYSSGILRLCPDCFTEAKELAEKLESVIGRRDFYFMGLFF